ncbi:RecE family exodeoxyribonuclease [Serratia fonticola]
MQNVYPYYLKAKAKSGKKSLFRWRSASNDGRGLRDFENDMEDAGIDPKHYFKAVRTNFPVVDDLPAEGEFCDKWCDRYCLGDDGLTWEQIVPESVQLQEAAKPAPVEVPTPVPAHDKDPREYFSKLSHAIKVTFVAMHDFVAIDTIFTKPEMDKVISVAIQQEDRYYADLIKALTIPAVMAMRTEPLAAFVAGVARRYEHDDPDSTFVNIRKYAEQLLAEPVNEPESGQVAEPETKIVFKRGYQQTYELLDREIASALWVGDVDFENIAGEIDRWAQKKIKNDDEDFKRWSMALRIVPNILKYSRESIFGVVRNAPSTDLYHFPGSLSTWIKAYLSQAQRRARQLSAIQSSW